VRPLRPHRQLVGARTQSPDVLTLERAGFIRR
jgi:hypothetical protein